MGCKCHIFIVFTHAPCLAKSDLSANLFVALVHRNRNSMADGDGRIGSLSRGREPNVMKPSVKWFATGRALLFGLAVPRCWKLAVPTLDAF
jgi:hypothetical protein